MKIFKRRSSFTRLTFLFLLGSLSVANGADPHSSGTDSDEGPWFTGPLLSPTGIVVPIGYIYIEPYLFINVTTGTYDEHWHARKVPNFYNYNVQLPIQIGLATWADFEVVPQASYNRTEGTSSIVFNDLSMTLSAQLYVDDSHKIPSLRLYIQELFPTGPYQRLRPDKKETDSGGLGSYQTTLGAVIVQTLHLYKKHYLNWRFNPYFTYPAPLTVRGFNAYGGGYGTRGRVRPGAIWAGIFGLQYSFTQNWALAFDLYGFYQYKTRFSGHAGILSDGSPASMDNPANAQISLAPAIEYNFNESIGLIAGSWFTIAGFNSDRFASFVIAFNYYGKL